MSNLMTNIKSGFKSVGKFVDKHSPEILLGCGIAGFVSTCVLVAKEAPIAEAALDELHEELGKSDEDMSKGQIIFEEFKTVAPIYAPSVISGAVSIGCVFGSYKIGNKRTAALATAYEITQATFTEYQNKVTEKLGEKKELEVRNAIAQDMVDRNPPPKSMCRSEEDTGDSPITDGKSLFMLGCNGRYVRTRREDIQAAITEITTRLTFEDWVSFNEFQYELDLSDTEDGDILGFIPGERIYVYYEPTIAPGGENCQVVRFSCPLVPKLKSY